ncbi:mycothione reductase [Nocardioides zeae]|uniref:Mycothione reductase n=1 Tax=Nocardioides imazamoxiresistens TaxID=3231893 RepID=A0ABU3PYK2_9ACTN|nr:mycothione reductase [Nocardioides zeae]MDT9594224.1 mycothione reductase [Nocardioides zeae]
MSAQDATHYDLVVVGAGSGNTIVDDRFSHLRVAIVERGPFGGTCVNRGCIPSKMYVHAAELATSALRGPALGVATGLENGALQAGARWSQLRERVLGRIDQVAADGEEYRRGLDFVDVLTGTARFTGPRRLVVETEEGERTLTADQVVLATGSRPVVPDVPGLHDVPHLTSDTVMRLEELPRRIVVLGGGYVGTELAHVLSGLGVAVLQVEGEDRLLSNQDREVGELVSRAAAQRWEVRLGVRLAEAHRTPDGSAELRLDDGSVVHTDLVLVAVGRRPNGDQLDLDAGGVAADDTGLIEVDEHQRTSVEGVWALGDASSTQPLKHVANQDARVVQHNLLHPDDLVVSDHRHVPNAVFTEPQVAAVGLTEEQAREQGLDLAVARQDVADTAYGWALQADPDDDAPSGPGGFVKLLADRSTGLLVGAHVVGPMAATLIQPLIQAISNDVAVRGLARSQYWIHPAPTEVVETALLALEEELS